MVSERLFAAIPPFPDEVSVADMSCIELKALESGESQCCKRMLSSCQDLGFFLLDLRGSPLGEKVISEVDQLFDETESLMSLPEDEKLQFKSQPGKSPLGFKPRGLAKTETQQPDRFQWFNLAQDGLLGNTPLQPLPETLLAHREVFNSFLTQGQKIVLRICEVLATGLNLPDDTFTSRQRSDQESGTVIRLIKADASPHAKDMRTSMVHHTDFGTVTLLANVLGGLQTLSPGASTTDLSSWLWVRPQPGCLVVNLGDAMVKWTGGILRSNMHRVNFAPGAQRYVDRYSLALLVRPEKNASMKTLLRDQAGSDEDDLTAWEWGMKRSMALVRGEDHQTRA